MNLDLGTLTGVLGVVLTVIFFFVGYRQTIGAKKERAAAANRQIIETMLRRFTLDSDFALQFDEVERFVAGTALDSRVKRSDVYSMDEIFSLLYSHIVISDYVPAKKRKSILEKLGKSFRPPPAEARVLDSMASRPVENTRLISVEALLGIGSGLLAAGVSAAAGFLASGWLDRLSAPSVRFALGMAIGVSAMTAIALVAYVRVRDKAVATAPDAAPADKAQEFEARFTERLRAVGIPFIQERDVDLIILTKQKRIAVELKFTAVPHNVRPMLNQLRRSLGKYKCDEGYLVLSMPVPERISALSDAQIKIMSADEFLALLTGPEPIREEQA